MKRADSWFGSAAPSGPSFASLIGLFVAFAALPAGAVPFTLTFTNTSTTANYDWSQGLLTLQPLIGVGLTPPIHSHQFDTYAFANSNCKSDAGFCTGACNDDGNVTVLAQRWGLTIGTNAWVVPAIPANNGTQTVTVDVPVGSRLSYIAWVNDTSVFDDFVAMHPPGDTSTLSIPLFDGSGNPLETLDYVVSGYDTNSDDPNNGSGGTCAPECPPPASGCYVAPGNASTNATGTFPGIAPSKVVNLTITSGNGESRLRWTDSTPHSGVVIARRAQAVTWTPTAGAIYTAPTQVAGGGNPTTVVYADDSPDGQHSATVAGINGTRYFFKVFPHANGHQYATGNVPSNAGLFSEPTLASGSNEYWCYSFGFPSMQQPVTKLGTAVFTANNGGTLTANLTTPGNGATDGSERWRPVTVPGGIQSRPLSVPTQIGDLLVVSDQSGHVTAVDPTSGAVVWVANNGAALGSAVQGQPVAQLNAFEGTFGAAGTAFVNANPGRDLIYVGTRNTGSSTNNKVYALSSVNGAVVWTYAPNNLDYISGGMAVDYARNRLYVGAHNGLRILSTLDGTQVGSLLAGVALDYGVNLDFVGGQAFAAYTVSTTGAAYGISLATMTQSWTTALGATSTWIFPTGNGFIASIKAGGVKRFTVSGATVTTLWTASPAVPTPTGATIAYALNKIYVGSADGNLRQLNYDTGVVEKTLSLVTVAPTDLGFPTIDSTVNRLHVGTMDGRLCAVPIPLP